MTIFFVATSVVINGYYSLYIYMSLSDNQFLLDSVDDWESKLDHWTQTAKVLDHVTEDVAKKFPGKLIMLLQHSYHELPLISPGLIKVQKGFWVGL